MKRTVGLIATVAAVSLLWASAASAATEFGSTCAADAAESELTLLQLTQAPENVLPLTAPVSGVITRWSIEDATGAAPGELPQALQVYRTAPEPNSFTLVNQTAQTPLVPGLNSIPARLPVQAGDRLGIYSVVATMYCNTGFANDLIGFNEEGPVQVGESRPFEGDPPFRIPVRAAIEPDADGDGYGDETQDQCPQSAAFQVACPPVALSPSSKVRKGSVTIIVTSSTAAPVSVLGIVKLGKGKKATLNGGTQNLAPGVLGKFTLKFTKGVKAKLKKLSPKKSLRLNVTVSGTSLSGAVTTNALKLKLKGQAKPKPKPKKPRRQAKS
jgi:hypothetical protein